MGGLALVALECSHHVQGRVALLLELGALGSHLLLHVQLMHLYFRGISHCGSVHASGGGASRLRQFCRTMLTLLGLLERLLALSALCTVLARSQSRGLS